jgi:hypothetical protein
LELLCQIFIYFTKWKASAVSNFEFSRISTIEELVIQNTSCVGAFAIVKKPNGFQFSTSSTNINNNNNNLARPFAKLFCAQNIRML